MPRFETRSIWSISSRGVIAKPGCSAPSRFASAADHLVIGAAFARRLDQLRPEDDVLMAAAAIDVVVLEEHRRRQHDVGHLRRLGHELLVHADEQVVARKAALDLRLVGRDRHRIGVLDEQRVDRRPALQGLAVAGQNRADARLVEHADRRDPSTSSPSIIVLSSW